jgi:large subunit ribosomal protein L2
MANPSSQKPLKSLIQRIKRTGGRNNAGRITSRHRGGGERKLYRQVEFGQAHINVSGTVDRIEYDPNRNALLALVSYQNGDKAYVLAAQGVQRGTKIVCAAETEPVEGNRMEVGKIPVGTMVYNVELEPGRGGKIVRSAGTGAKVAAHEGKYTFLQLPSTEIRKVWSACFASVGMVSNPEHRYKKLKKAGASRHKGIRPHVRGVAMNPVDHPHGGGEGRSSIGMKYPKTPWGKHALGVKTRNKKKWTGKMIVSRRKKKSRK